MRWERARLRCASAGSYFLKDQKMANFCSFLLATSVDAPVSMVEFRWSMAQSRPRYGEIYTLVCGWERRLAFVPGLGHVHVGVGG